MAHRHQTARAHRVYFPYPHMSHKSLSPRKLELKQPFAYQTSHELGSFTTNKNHIRRGDSLFGKLKNFLRFFSSLDTSFPVWGKFKLPTAKAAPKFLLAEGEGKKKKRACSSHSPPLCRMSTAWGCSCAWRARCRGQDGALGWDGGDLMLSVPSALPASPLL